MSLESGLALFLMIISATCLRLGAADLSSTFYLEGNHLHWDAAQNYCMANLNNLASVRNQQESTQLPKCNSGACWIGLKKDADNVWRWSDGSTASFLNWKGGQPDKNKYCTTVGGGDQKWSSDVCDESHPFICNKEHLILVNEEMTWEEALDYCRSHFTDLPSVLTSDDFSYAQNAIQDAQTDQVWTGLRYLGSQWYWVHGNQLQTPNLPVCPAQGRLCGTLPKTGMTLGTENCEEERNVICYNN